MAYTLPPAPSTQSCIIPVAEYSSTPAKDTQDNSLHISIDQATYEPQNERAQIVMSDALAKSNTIRKYHGNTIVLIYKNEDINYKACPHIRVPIEDITRNINFTENTVTISISNVPQGMADRIQKTLCLFINADTVHYVSALVFPPPPTRDKPYEHLNK